MTTPYLGEIQLFGFNFAPYQWTQCNGATLPISQYTALFSLLGTFYGGNGQTNFQIPNFVDRAGCNQGTGPGLSQRTIGETFGEEMVTLTTPQLPMHNHGFSVYGQRDQTKRASSPSPGNGLLVPGQVAPFLQNATSNTNLASAMLAPSGGSQPHENRQPYLAVNYCIALYGAFPSFG